MMGPYSSGKSLMCLFDLLMDAMDMPECMDGIRRSRTCIMRTTYNELQTTTIKSFLDWFGNFGYPPPDRSKTFIKMPYPTYHVRFNDGHGIVDWEVMFLAFDREEHVKKLGSLEVTNVYCNELRDFAFAIYQAATGRMGRYPKTIDLGDGVPYYKSLKSDTNPPDQDHWLYKLFEVEKPPGYTMFHQPPAVLPDDDSEIGWKINPNADNLKHNTAGYYLTLVTGKTREFIRVFAEGKYGSAADGKKVFEEYNDDIHAYENVEWLDGQPLYLGWDFGLTPCLLISQFYNGQLRVLKEFVTESMGIENLIEDRVRPYWSQHNLDRFSIGSSDADPAGAARSAKNVREPNLIEIISDKFKRTQPALTNDTETRLEAVRHYLSRMSGGQPALIISKSGCPVLRKGFNGHYVLRKRRMAGKGEDMYDKKPDKSHPISEPQDCLQYIALRLSKTLPVDTKAEQRKVATILNKGRVLL